MRDFRRIMIAAGLLCGAPVAQASSPAAWGELNSRASAACLKESGFNEAKVRGLPVYFDELVLLIVEGRHAQAHMKNAAGTKYCLYGKTTAKTQVSEMPLPATPVAAAPAAPAVATGRTCWSETVSMPMKWPSRIGKPCLARNALGDVTPGIVR